MTTSHGSTSNGVTTESPRPRLPTTRLGDTPGQYCYPRDCTPDRAVALGLLVDVTPEAREVTLSGYPILFSRWAYDEQAHAVHARDRNSMSDAFDRSSSNTLRMGV